ncbi:putative fasciclin-like arabinogalactan protein [Medicago truncatula]|uniref:Fasciclin domain protein n=1 Tax=Medicago truncatula TaxID=3880 RepID=A0A072VCL3_MEDTR|nr:fasciclin-like arabinogalactan protein 3 [Medicago truncatula]KEH39774.1 fasciclin domain protein [Medicago truncatula]RHN76837.1 putative fasciclin-like arabinogalactan protein [Medicago truncatula]
MGFKSSSLLCLALFLAVSSSIHALDITKLLGQNPDFAAFNKQLTETKLVDQINSRNTITVLAVSDGAMSAISGKSPQAIKAIMSTHVVLDYFDEKKLSEAVGSGILLTTLFQASGQAKNQQGFLKVKLIGEGEMDFGSAVSGAPIDVALVKTVVKQPYNISILQVAKPIIFPGVDSVSTASAPTAAKNASSPSAAKADAPTAETPSESATAPSPSKEPATNAPAEAPTAEAAGPGGAAADAPPPSSSSRTVVGLVGAMMCFASLLVVM